MTDHPYTIDFLLKRVARARAEGDVERARPDWERCVIRATARVRATVRGFQDAYGRRVAAQDHDAVVNDALDRANRRMIETLENLTEPVFKAAMVTCAEKACMDHLRREAARERHTAGSIDEPGHEDGGGGRYDSTVAEDEARRRADAEAALEAAARLDAALARMTNERRRRAVQLKRLGFSNDEIAAELGVSMANAYQLLSRGLRDLRRLMMEP